MAYNIDFVLASSNQIEKALCKRLGAIRLSRNITQEELAREAGVSERTIRRLEKGQGVSLDTFLRVLSALGIQQHVEALLPDPRVRPMDRIGRSGSERKRARPEATRPADGAWEWGDGEVDDDS